MRTDAPGGDTVELHRRCWIGRGGATPPGCVRVAASALGYASDLEFVFPPASGVFKAGGDLAFHHGGPSLQELVIPVLTVRTKARESARPSAGPDHGDRAARRGHQPDLQRHAAARRQNQSLFSSAGLSVRPLLMAAGKQVGAVGMAVDAEFDRATGCVTLEPGQAGHGRVPAQRRERARRCASSCRTRRPTRSCTARPPTSRFDLECKP